MYIIKRDGTQVEFNSSKIYNAVSKANADPFMNNYPDERLSEDGLAWVTEAVTSICESMNRMLNVEEIQNLVEEALLSYDGYSGRYHLAKCYMDYRRDRQIARAKDEFFDRVMTIIDGNNEEVQQENSNKNPSTVFTKRDYIAGEVNKEICETRIFDADVIEAHKSGKIHNHDMDYRAMRMTNCQLVNLEDIFENGTVIQGTLIETPKSFSTACNVMTQEIAQIASGQYGGQSLNMAHLAKFINVSRKKYHAKAVENTSIIEDPVLKEAMIKRLIASDLKEDVKRGVQMIQYQITTLMTTNGWCKLGCYKNWLTYQGCAC